MPGRRSETLSLSRRFLLWFLRHPPFDPYVSASVSTDFGAALAYLDRLNADGDAPRVSVQHLVTAALARCYCDFPMANAHVHGARILRRSQVGVAMPVSLLSRTDGGPETTVVLVEQAQHLSLREIAARTRRDVEVERSGKAAQPFVRVLMRVAEHLPQRAMDGLLDGVDALSRLPIASAALHRRFPMTAVVSNVGAAVPMPPGALARGASFSPPHRVFHVGTVLGVFPVQQEVLAVEGRARVRPVLPMTYVFDHRLFDGVMSGRILARLAGLLQDPEAEFGPDGRARGPDHLGPGA